MRLRCYAYYSERSFDIILYGFQILLVLSLLAPHLIIFGVPLPVNRVPRICVVQNQRTIE